MGSLKDLALPIRMSARRSGDQGQRDLWEELKSRPVLNANLLDYLLEHPHFDPSESLEAGTRSSLSYHGVRNHSGAELVALRFPASG